MIESADQATFHHTMTKPKPTNELMKRGRPSTFKPEYVEQAKKLCLLGATDEDIADFLTLRCNA
jgi:hypothetical protein